MSLTALHPVLADIICAAGPKGITTDELIDDVSERLGIVLRRSQVTGMIFRMRRDEQVCVAIKRLGSSSRYTPTDKAHQGVQSSVDEVADEPFQLAPDLPPHASLTAMLCGDPAPGRSFWDRLSPQQREARA